MPLPHPTPLGHPDGPLAGAPDTLADPTPHHLRAASGGSPSSAGPVEPWGAGGAPPRPAGLPPHVLALVLLLRLLPLVLALFLVVTAVLMEAMA